MHRAVVPSEDVALPLVDDGLWDFAYETEAEALGIPESFLKLLHQPSLYLRIVWQHLIVLWNGAESD
jgi:hypothetical protein